MPHRPLTNPIAPAQPANFTRTAPLRHWRLRHHLKACLPVHGAVRLDVERVCRERGIVVERGPHKGRANLAMLGRLTGLSYVTLYNLLRRPGRHQGVSLETLTRLCEGIGCEPGELFSYEPFSPAGVPRESYHYGAQATRPRHDTDGAAAEFRAALPHDELRAAEVDAWSSGDIERAS
jgi:DNA-binding Xre family transcriptional regulator